MKYGHSVSIYGKMSNALDCTYTSGHFGKGGPKFPKSGKSISDNVQN